MNCWRLWSPRRSSYVRGDLTNHRFQTPGCLQANRWRNCGSQAAVGRCDLVGTAVTGAPLPQQPQVAPAHSRTSIILEFRPHFASSNDVSKEVPKSEFLCETSQLLIWLIFLNARRFKRKKNLGWPVSSVS